ncbi:MAG: HdeD family acid-resistance protein [Sphaerochaetaceae bacterium]|jgi:uncharacterized membrane protein HdeD (DUF308 family)
MKMTNAMKAHWWFALFVGLLVCALGCYMLFATESFVKVAVIIMGLLAIVSGTLTLVELNSYTFGVSSKRVTIFKGVLGIAVGLLVLFLPVLSAKVTVVALLYIIGIQLVLSAIIAFWDAFSLRGSGLSLSGLVTEGVLSLVFALLMFLFPQSVGRLVVRVVGILVLAGGIGFIVWAFRLRTVARRFGRSSSSPTYIEGEAEVLDDDK